MKYIVNGGSGWDHRPYWLYLESVRDEMPSHIHAFASAAEHHDLSSPSSLHDAWLEQLIVEERPALERRRGVQISAQFIGPHHDRHITLAYSEVSFYELRGPEAASIHGDILVHEMRVKAPGIFEHEILFATGARFVVAFAGFEHRNELAR